MPRTVIIPMIFGRKDNTSVHMEGLSIAPLTWSPHRIYLHGHLSSRLLKVLSEDGQVKACLAFTTVTGVVVAMSPFHNSNNYESAVLCKLDRVCHPIVAESLADGFTRFIDDDKEKLDALTRITNHAFRAPDGSEGDRWALSRETSDIEVSRRNRDSDGVF